MVAAVLPARQTLPPLRQRCCLRLSDICAKVRAPARNVGNELEFAGQLNRRVPEIFRRGPRHLIPRRDAPINRDESVCGGSGLRHPSCRRTHRVRYGRATTAPRPWRNFAGGWLLGEEMHVLVSGAGCADPWILGKLLGTLDGMLRCSHTPSRRTRQWCTAIQDLLSQATGWAGSSSTSHAAPTAIRHQVVRGHGPDQRKWPLSRRLRTGRSADDTAAPSYMRPWCRHHYVLAIPPLALSNRSCRAPDRWEQCTGGQAVTNGDPCEWISCARRVVRRTALVAFLVSSSAGTFRWRPVAQAACRSALPSPLAPSTGDVRWTERTYARGKLLRPEEESAARGRRDNSRGGRNYGPAEVETVGTYRRAARARRFTTLLIGGAQVGIIATVYARCRRRTSGLGSIISASCK